MMRKYDDEFKQQAVKKILDGQSAASLSRELGVGESQLHKWKRMKIDSGSDLEKENLKLKKLLRELQMENAHSKKGGAYLRQRNLERYKFIDGQPAKRLVSKNVFMLIGAGTVPGELPPTWRSGGIECGWR